MKIRNYFLIAVGGALLGAVSGFAWRALNDAGQPDFPTPIETALTPKVKPIDLVTTLLKEMQGRHDLDTSRVDDVMLGCVMSTGSCRSGGASADRAYRAGRRRAG